MSGTGLSTRYVVGEDVDVAALADLAHADGNFIVSNGTTWVVESGNTARTSLGLGTGDIVEFSGLKLGTDEYLSFGNDDRKLWAHSNDFYIKSLVHGGNLWLQAETEAGVTRGMKFDPDIPRLELGFGIDLLIEATGKLTDGTNELTVANIKAAYDHLTGTVHTELDAWIDDVTLANGGAITTPGDISGKNITASSTTFPVLDVIRTVAGAYMRGGVRIERVIPAASGSNDEGTGIYFKTENDAGDSTFAGIIGGVLSDVTDGAEIGRLIFNASWQGDDPYDRAQMTLTATSASVADLVVTGDISCDDFTCDDLVCDELVTTDVASNLIPDTSGAYDLGSSQKKWQDLFLSRNLSDGTNSLTVANIKTAYDWGDHSAGGYQAQGDVLDDLKTLGANAADSEFLVGTGAGALAWESGATVRTSLGLTIGTDVQAYDAFLLDIANLTDPGADRILFWDETANDIVWLTLGTNLSITDTTLNAAAGGDVARTGSSTDNKIARWHSTTATIQTSLPSIDDNGNIILAAAGDGFCWDLVNNYIYHPSANGGILVYSDGPVRFIPQNDASNDYLEVEWGTPVASNIGLVCSGSHFYIHNATAASNIYLQTASGSVVINDSWTAAGQTCADLGTVTLGALGAGVTQAEWDAAYTHVSNDGSDHSFIDQSVVVAGTPQFANLGVGTAASANAIIYAIKTFTSADTVLAINGSITNTYAAGAPIKNTSGLVFTANYTPALTGNLVLAGGGVYASDVTAVANNATAHDLTIPELVGIRGKAQIINSGGGNTTVTKAYALIARTAGNADTIGTNYGLLVEDAAQGSTNYAIYTAGASSDSYLEGDISAQDVTDRASEGGAKAWGGTQREALDAICKVKSNYGHVGEAGLPTFALRTVVEQRPTGEVMIMTLPDGEKEERIVTEPIELPARSLGAMVTVLTEAVKELNVRVVQLEKAA